MKKRIFSLILTLAMLAGLFPTLSVAAEEAGITVRVRAQDGFEYLYTSEALTVTDGLAEEYGFANASSVAEGTITALDVLVAAHAEMLGSAFTAETAASYLTMSSGNPLTMFGNAEMTKWSGFAINHAYSMNSSSVGYVTNSAPVEDGDVVDFFYYEDPYWGDYLTWFTDANGNTVDNVTVNAGESFTLKLQGYMMMLGFTSPTPIDIYNEEEGLWICEANSTDVLGYVASDEGLTLSFDTAGTYYLTAQGFENSSGSVIIPPYCVVTVEGGGGAPEPEPAKKHSLTVAYAAASAGINIYDSADAAEPVATTATGIAAELAEGVYWVEGVDKTGSMGRVQISLAGDTAVTLLLARYRISNDSYSWISGTDYTAHAEANTGVRYIQGVGDTTYPYRYTVVNGDTVYFTATPIGDKAAGYLTYHGSRTYTFAAASNIAIPVRGNGTIVVPENAELTLWQRPTPYVRYAGIAPVAEPLVDTEAGTKTYTFTLAVGQSYYYTVRESGKVTYAGWKTAAADTSIVVTEADMTPNGAVPSTLDRDLSSNGKQNVGNVYININERGHLELKTGQSHQIVAIRSWQTVASSTGSDFIEPDFHYTVLNTSGAADDSVVTVDESGLLTAVGNGTAIVLVTYDAITVNGSFFGAIWPENTGVFVVTVGGNGSGIDLRMTVPDAYNVSGKEAGSALDAEHDIIYYLAGTDGAYYSFTPAAGSAVTVMRPVISGDEMSFPEGFVSSGVIEAEGEFTVRLTEGRNIVRVEKDGRCAYQVITAKKLSYTVTNETNPGGTIEPGDTINIIFDTLYHPSNKLATVYNMSARLQYIFNGTTIQGKSSSQYTFASTAGAQTISLTVPDDAEGSITLTGGSVYVSGFGDPYGGHRAVTYEVGKNPNFTALMRYANMSILPDIKIPLGETPEEKPEISDNARLSSIISSSGMLSNYSGSSYGASVANSVTAITLTATPEDSKATLEISSDNTDWTAITGGKATAPLSLSVGSNSFYIRVTAENGAATETYSVVITRNLASTGEVGNAITVRFSLTGDSHHYIDDDNHGTHNSQVWISSRTVAVESGSTVKDLTDKLLSENGLGFDATDGNYIAKIQNPSTGAMLGEFDNGPNSGWMYRVNGVIVRYGYAEQELLNGDVISWFYTDDYTLEKGYDENWDEVNGGNADTGTGTGTGSGAGAGTGTKTGSADDMTEIEDEETPLAELSGFSDVKPDDWFFDAVMYAADKGLVNGVGDNLFDPDGKMTRAMLVTILYRVEQEPEVAAENAFTDVASDQWYTSAVLWANENGIVDGYGDGLFGTNDPITREQMALILMRYAEYKGLDTSKANDLGAYTDASEISEWALSAVKWANAEGLINGITETAIEPDGVATRAQVAVILMRFIENLL